jgi:hypothetical protein
VVSLPLRGKGIWIRRIAVCENGDLDAVVAKAKAAAFTHLCLKIADGADPCNLDPAGTDLATELAARLADAGLEVWGWQQVYGDTPLFKGALRPDYHRAEADRALERMAQLQAAGARGFVVVAGGDYDRIPDRARKAEQFAGAVRAGLSLPIGLSAWKYPHRHPRFPWDAFRAHCDLDLPQIFWIGKHGEADRQLETAAQKFAALTPRLPFVPVGPAFYESNWRPAPDELRFFLELAIELGFPAASLWDWDNLALTGAEPHNPQRLDFGEHWSLVADFQWREPKAVPFWLQPPAPKPAPEAEPISEAPPEGAAQPEPAPPVEATLPTEIAPEAMAEIPAVIPTQPEPAPPVETPAPAVVAQSAVELLGEEPGWAREPREPEAGAGEPIIAPEPEGGREPVSAELDLEVSIPEIESAPAPPAEMMLAGMEEDLSGLFEPEMPAPPAEPDFDLEPALPAEPEWPLEAAALPEPEAPREFEAPTAPEAQREIEEPFEPETFAPPVEPAEPLEVEPPRPYHLEAEPAEEVRVALEQPASFVALPEAGEEFLEPARPYRADDEFEEEPVSFALSAELEDEDLPEWLSEFGAEAEALGSFALQPEEEYLEPARPYRADDEFEEEPVSFAPSAELEDEDLPEWLSEFGAEAEALGSFALQPGEEYLEPARPYHADDEFEEEPVSFALSAELEDEDLPEWLREPEAASFGPAPQPESAAPAEAPVESAPTAGPAPAAARRPGTGPFRSGPPPSLAIAPPAPDTQEGDTVGAFFNALRDGDLDQALALYGPGFSHVNADRVERDPSALREFYAALAGQIEAQGLVWLFLRRTPLAASVQWITMAKDGQPAQGTDSFHLNRAGRIVYHHTSYRLESEPAA